jgi:hypothetical protein
MVRAEDKDFFKGGRMKLLSSTIQWKQFHAPWAPEDKVLCPWHKKEEAANRCPVLAVMHAPSDTEIVVVDFGRRIDPPSISGWECIWGSRSGGGAHQWYAYMRLGVGARVLYEFLATHKNNNFSHLEMVGDGKIYIWSSCLGLWIGSGGR